VIKVKIQIILDNKKIFQNWGLTYTISAIWGMIGILIAIFTYY